MKMSKKKALYLATFVIFGGAFAIIELFGISFSSDPLLDEIWYGIVTRLLGSIICVAMVLYCSYGKIFGIFGGGGVKSFLLLIPCWLVVVNNFPFLAVWDGRAVIDCAWQLIALYALQCFLVGCFEEIAFRGCLFMLILEGKHKTRKEIFWSVIYSSAIFGGIHLANLLAGAGIVPVIQQVGYSFLIGAMCAIALLVTRKIWMSILLHSVFNFAGGVVPTLVGNHVEIWDTATIVITAVLAVAVTAYVIVLFVKMDISNIHTMFEKNKKDRRMS